MASGFENMPTQKTEDESKNIPKVDQGDAMESFIKREYDVDVKTPEEKQGDAMKSFLEREYGEGDKKESREDEKRENKNQQEEKNKVYERIEDDPMIKEIKTEILKRTNQEVKEAQEGKQGGIASRESSGQSIHNFWDRTYSQVAMQQWDIFVHQYPEKAQAYRDKIEFIGKSLDTQEEKQKKLSETVVDNNSTQEKKESSKEIFKEIELLEGDKKLEKLKEINSDLKNALEKMLDPSVSQEDFQKIISDFNDVNMKEKEGAYNSVELDDGRITVKYYENGSFSISGRYNEERGIIEMEDLEDKELIKLSNEMKKAREDYNKNKEKTDGAWQRIRNVFPKLVLGENSASAQEAQIYLKRYEEARNNLLKYQTEKLRKRNLPKEKRVKEVADLSKHYNEDEQYDSLDKKTGEKFKFSDEEKNENKTRKKENKESSVEKNRKKALGEMFKKYKINEKDGYYDQSSGFIDKLMREVAMGHYENWKNSKDKKIADLVDEKGNPRDEISKNIQKMEKYFENILGEKGKIEKNETVKQWLVRIIKESLEYNK